MSEVYFWSLVLLVVLIALFGGIMLLRKWINADQPTSTGPGFTLSDLRELHRQGKMSDEEFERAKSKMIASNKPADQKPHRP